MLVNFPILRQTVLTVTGVRLLERCLWGFFMKVFSGQSSKTFYALFMRSVSPCFRVFMGMFAFRIEKKKVGNIVVQLISINVMNDFLWGKFSSKGCFKDVTMFKELFAVNGNRAVSPISDSPTFKAGVAGTASKFNTTKARAELGLSWGWAIFFRAKRFVAAFTKSKGLVHNFLYGLEDEMSLRSNPIFVNLLGVA